MLDTSFYLFSSEDILLGCAYSRGMFLLNKSCTVVAKTKQICRERERERERERDLQIKQNPVHPSTHTVFRAHSR